MMTQKVLPSTYNKELKESIEPMLDHVKNVSDSIQIANGVLSTLATVPRQDESCVGPFYAGH